MATFCVRAAHHTHHVLNLLLQLKNLSNIEYVRKTYSLPSTDDADYPISMKIPDGSGNLVRFPASAKQIKGVLDFVGFNNIPFDHSIGMLSVFSNVFCPTDNLYTGEQLGYYRQREWRLIAGDLKFNGRHLGRALSQDEKDTLLKIDKVFWERELQCGKLEGRRCDLAFIYDPIEDWNPLALIDAIFAPECILDDVRSLIGDAISVRGIPEGL